VIEKTLTTAALEQVYDLIADGIDTAGEERAPLFLAKLSLALSALVGDPDKIRTAVEASLRDL